ncbi:MAG: 2-amino-4-hydroxy-6-hydroxymethyldihydropteridine diphosphokinase [Anaerolineales bacterium]|nr:2-amino-4-hydroxy-6-hydroxymethyldihydropteridine diphosphokinase [Anaerolineales bacterium]
MATDQKTTVYLALGTNLGDREKNLSAARERLSAEITIRETSSIYETEPWGWAEQADFLNQVIQGTTSLPPQKLLNFIKQIELDLGRKPGIRYGPRVIDIDILFYGDHVFSSHNLTIPHPRIAERAFVLVPLGEIDSDLQIPGSGETVRDLLAVIDQKGVKVYSSINHHQ